MAYMFVNDCHIHMFSWNTRSMLSAHLESIVYEATLREHCCLLLLIATASDSSAFRLLLVYLLLFGSRGGRTGGPVLSTQEYHLCRDIKENGGFFIFKGQRKMVAFFNKMYVASN